MGIFKTLGDFLFGKDPDIFDANGRVVHKFDDQKWKNWDNRLKQNPTYDWKKHGAVERVEKSGNQPKKD